MSKSFLLINAKDFQRAIYEYEDPDVPIVKVVGKEKASIHFENHMIPENLRYIILTCNKNVIQSNKSFMKTSVATDFFTGKQYLISPQLNGLIKGYSSAGDEPNYSEFITPMIFASKNNVNQFYKQLVEAESLNNYLSALSDFYRANDFEKERVI